MGAADVLATNLLSPVVLAFVLGAAVTLLVGLVTPLTAYAALRSAVGLDRVTAGALAAHYGSVSAVTFPFKWEGPSIKLETLVSDEVAHRIVDEVAKYFEHHALVVYTTEVRVVRPGKFG